MLPSVEPLQLITADSRRLGGGDREVKLVLSFRVQNGENGDKERRRMMGRFHDADTKDDMI